MSTTSFLSKENGGNRLCRVGNTHTNYIATNGAKEVV